MMKIALFSSTSYDTQYFEAANNSWHFEITYFEARLKNRTAHLAARFNNVDLAADADAGISIVRVPAYSPEVVAEHALALILTLNRKTHKAYNRVREGNFSAGTAHRI